MSFAERPPCPASEGGGRINPPQPASAGALCVVRKRAPAQRTMDAQAEESRAYVRQWKARRPTSAKGRFPYPHRTCADWRP